MKGRFRFCLEVGFNGIGFNQVGAGANSAWTIIKSMSYGYFA